MSTAFEVPLKATPQKLAITLNGVDYHLTVHWCDPASCWVLDIADDQDNPILYGVPLVTGADLLEQYAYLNFGGQLIVQTDSDLNAVPTFDNLGTTGHLYFLVP